MKMIKIISQILLIFLIFQTVSISQNKSIRNISINVGGPWQTGILATKGGENANFTHTSRNITFIPWNSEINIADENIKIKNKAKNKIATVFNGPQAGSFFLIRFFQIFISPQDGPNCRFRPTCAAYGRIAVSRYGAIIGAFLAGDRIIRCNPYSLPGDDPVPVSIIKCNYSAID